ncbi:MAG: 50S ribosomal protein L9 [Clostridia bacterium]|nr:50S ribosomal protein L9 [Clostridia bacterium]
MRVVLNQDIKGIGKKNQIVEVSEGYARNFLIPKKMVSVADNRAINEAKNRIESLAFKKGKEIEAAEGYKKKIEESFIEFKHKVGEGSKLFGSVTEKDISEAIKAKFNISVDKKKVMIKNPIKNLGTYTVDIKLYEGIVAKLKIVVVGQ